MCLPPGGHTGPTAQVTRPTETQGPGWLRVPTVGLQPQRERKLSLGAGWRGRVGTSAVSFYRCVCTDTHTDKHSPAHRITGTHVNMHTGTLT